MPPRLRLARYFLLGGAVLIGGGLLIWFCLPIRSSFPPFVFTGALALIYGFICRRPVAPPAASS